MKNGPLVVAAPCSHEPIPAPSAGANLADRVWYAWHCLPRGPDGKPPSWRTLERAHGLPESMLSALFGGRRKSPAVGTAVRMAKALQVDLHWLLEGEGQKPTLTGPFRHRDDPNVAERRRRACTYLERMGFARERVEQALHVLFDESSDPQGSP